MFDETQPGVAYAFAGLPAGPALARSTDDGVSWTLVNGQAADGLSAVLAFTVLPGMGGGLAFVEQLPSGSMVLRTSTDGGVSWASLPGPPISSPGVVISGPRTPGLHVADPQTFYFCYPGALWKSADGGNTWTNARSWNGLGSLTCLFALDAQNPSVALLADPSTNQLLRTTDGAVTWIPVVQNVPIGDVVFDPQHDDTAFASTGRGVLKSTDNGQTWTATTTGVPFDAAAAMYSVGASAPYPVVMQTSGPLPLNGHGGDVAAPRRLSLSGPRH